MAKPITPEEKLLIMADLRRGTSGRKVAKKFKRSQGTIHNIKVEMDKIDGMNAEDLKEKKLEDTLFFLNKIDEVNSTHTKKIQQSIFDLMRDDEMAEIIKAYKKILQTPLAANSSVAKTGISHFTQAIEMISRQNVNISAHELKKLEYEIRKLELELKNKEFDLKLRNIKGPQEIEDEEDAMEQDVELSFMDALKEAISETDMSLTDDFIEPISLEAVAEEKDIMDMVE